MTDALKRIAKGFWNIFILSLVISLIMGAVAICMMFPWLNLVWFIPFMVGMAWVFGE